MDKVLVGLIAIPLVVGCSALGGLVFMWLWNSIVVWVIPSAPVLSFYKAWALSFFIGIVTGGSSSSK